MISNNTPGIQEVLSKCSASKWAESLFLAAPHWLHIRASVSISLWTWVTAVGLEKHKADVLFP